MLEYKAQVFNIYVAMDSTHPMLTLEDDLVHFYDSCRWRWLCGGERDGDIGSKRKCWDILGVENRVKD